MFFPQLLFPKFLGAFKMNFKTAIKLDTVQDCLVTLKLSSGLKIVLGAESTGVFNFLIVSVVISYIF
jgi:hypothetical protein